MFAAHSRQRGTVRSRSKPFSAGSQDANSSSFRSTGGPFSVRKRHGRRRNSSPAVAYTQYRGDAFHARRAHRGQLPKLRYHPSFRSTYSHPRRRCGKGWSRIHRSISSRFEVWLEAAVNWESSHCQSSRAYSTASSQKVYPGAGLAGAEGRSLWSCAFNLISVQARIRSANRDRRNGDLSFHWSL